MALLVTMVAFWNVTENVHYNLSHWSAKVTPSWVGSLPGAKNVDPRLPTCDLDTRLIHDGLLLAPTFPKTLRWWTGTWVGQVPFYRPLTSYLFWVEWKTFGDYEARWHLIANMIHLLAVYQFILLACELFAWFRLPRLAAALAGAAFIHGLYALPSQALVAQETFGQWKNQPDSLTLVWFCLALRLYVRRMCREEESEAISEPDMEASGMNARRPNVRFAPLCVYLLVCVTKEAGVFLPLLLPFLEAPFVRAGGPERARALRRCVPLLVALPLFLVFRGLCLHNPVGFRYGSGSAWTFLLASNAGGMVSQTLTQGQWLPVLVAGAWLAGLARLWYGHRRVPAFTLRQNLAAFGIGLLVTLLIAQQGVIAGETGIVRLATALLLLFMPSVLRDTFGVTLFALAVGLLLRERPRLALFAYAWAILALGLTLFSPTMLHRFYLVNAGFALLMGGGWAIACDRLLSVMKPVTKPPDRTEAAKI